MNLKKFFTYFLLPIITILLIPYLTNNAGLGKIEIIRAIIAGLFLGSIRCLWEAYQHRKQKTDY